MCGFAGIVDSAGVGAEEVSAMASCLAHRGPDDAGAFAEGPYGVAHRRLAILDTSAAGHQPMSSGPLVLAYNGEIYNFRALASELTSRGRRFRSRSDTEVLLAALSEWGEDALCRLDGMFAFALWDREKQELLLVRDRFGIKPLYWAEHEGRFLFGSEVKALLAAGAPTRVDQKALVEYFTFQNVFTDRTLFEGVRLLPPGHVMRIGLTGRTEKRWWDLELAPDATRTEAQWSADVREALDAAVEGHLVSDVPLGSYLSGGMDSASIVALASRRRPGLDTFTGGFDMSSVSGLELVYDERDKARLVSETFGTTHHEVVMHSGDMARVMRRLAWHIEDPRAGTCYQNLYVAELAARSVEVALAGTGGDEVFAGYPWRYELVADAHDPAEFDERYFAYWNRVVPVGEHEDLFTADVLREARGHDPFDVYRQVIAPADGLDPVSRALYFEAKTFLHALLVVEDKLSMSVGLEVRVPFLGRDLVELAGRIPAGLKYRESGGKEVLRSAMRGILPGEILDSPKQGFTPPEGSWYRGESVAYVRDVLLEPRSLSRGYFRAEFTQRILREHLAGLRNHRQLIWSLLMFEWWNRVFVDGERP